MSAAPTPLSRPGAIVEVEWMDIETTIGWQDNADLDVAKSAPLCPALSVGYLVANEPDRIIIIQSLTHDSHAERTVIPKAVVRHIRRISARRPRSSK